MPSPKDPIKRAEWIRKLRIATTKRWQDPDELHKHGLLMRIVGNRPEVKKKRSAAMRGEKNPAKRPEVRKILSDQKLGDKNPAKRPEVRIKLSAAAVELRKDPEYVSKLMVARGDSPNKPEKFLTRLFQKFFPNQIRYVGDGMDKDFIFAGRCPDFIHINQKKIIEMFGDYWHGEKVTGIPNEQHEQERVAHFARYGFQTLIIWEHELGDSCLLQKKVGEFIGD